MNSDTAPHQAPLGARILGVGKALPSTVYTNADLSRFVDTSDEWVRERTGIRERRISHRELGETTLSLTLAACRDALADAKLDPRDIDLIVVGTLTPDTPMPTTANAIQAALGAQNAFSFDLAAACSGFLYALSIAEHFIARGTVRHALVAGGETLSAIVNWQDRSTAVLFGDGSGAVVLGQTTSTSRILGFRLGSDGTKSHLLHMEHGYTAVPTLSAPYRYHQSKVKMRGKELFKIAVQSMVESSERVLESLKLTVNDISCFILHQANLRIIDACIDRLQIPREKVPITVDKYGNTSASTLPITLAEAKAQERFSPGDLVLMSTFGGGLTWGSAVMRM